MRGSPGGTRELAFDKGANKPPEKNIVITTYKGAVFRTNAILIQQDHILENHSVPK